MFGAKKILFACILTLCGAVTMAQKAEQPFLSVDGKMYYPRDFFNSYFEAYLKSDNKAAFTPESFIETFANDIVMLNQARAQGIDTLSSLRKAIENYTKIYTAPYYYDSQSVEKLGREAAERSKEDLLVSHILIPVSKFAFEKDSLTAKARIDSVYQALKAGTPFDTLAVRINENGYDGDLGWVTAFQLPYALETAAYKTPAGQFSEPIRTDFGYHIVRTAERRPAHGLVELAHIMIVRKGSDSLDYQSLADIKEAYARIRKGEAFDKVAINYTEDASSQADGGYIGFYGIGELLPEIEALVFALEPGQTTSIIATPTGWEIIKVLSKVQNSDYQARKDFLDRRVMADARYAPFQEAYAKSKLAGFPLKVNEKQYETTFETLSNMGFLLGEWKSGLIKNSDEELFTLGDSTYTAGNFYGSLIYNMDNYGEDAELRQIVKYKFDEFVSRLALDMYIKSLPETDSKVKSSIEDFRNKSIIYTLISQYAQDQLDKVDPDTLRALYDNSPDKYMWGRRVHYEGIRCQDPVMAENIRQMMKQGKSYLEILSQLNKGLVAVADGHENTDLAEKVFKEDFDLKEGVSDIVQEGDSYFVFNIREIIPPARKTYEEAAHEVRNDYLALCSEQYPLSLRQGHDVQAIKKQVKNLVKAVNTEKKARGIQ